MKSSYLIVLTFLLGASQAMAKDADSTGYKYKNVPPVNLQDIRNLAIADLRAAEDSGSPYYIKNQFGAIQTASFNIQGNGKVSGSFIAKGAPGGARFVIYDGATDVIRWGIGNSGTETGTANIGNNFTIWRYANNGSYLGPAIEINRNNGSLETFYPTYLANESRVRGTTKDINAQSILYFADSSGIVNNGNKSGYVGFPTNNKDIYVTSYNGGVTLNSVSGAVNLQGGNNTTNAYLFWQQSIPAGPPRFNTRSEGTKIVLYPQVTTNASDFAIGTETNHVWFSTSRYFHQQGFKFYGGDSVVARLSSAGQLETKLAGRFLGEVDPAGATNGALAGPGAEVTTNAGNAVVRGYNRTSSVYIPTQIVGGNNNTTAFTFNLSDGYYFTNLANSSMLGTDATGKLISSNSIIYLDRTNNNVGINTTDTKGYKLAVNGNVIANKITVKAYPWADFVFDDNYKLPSLASVEAFIKQHKHLPNIPPAKEVADKGIELGDINSKLLQTVEELTLHAIEQEKLLKTQQQQIEQQQKLIQLLSEKVETLLKK
ncbi:hypothetical protein LX64_04607 [Chitinophaga skermanii]|uniref:Peptidase S74 domain-containing protein n=1 Tax=Chitinophaga skermanii TaxID=331697 RepID=A0A327Q6H3_9BACT|nr:hypothetical protein [Chitinophaga skermanii]RAI99473.1 hypothetical protein LX64_04607 [Chitinophaga skermanii]